RRSSRPARRSAVGHRRHSPRRPGLRSRSAPCRRLRASARPARPRAAPHGARPPASRPARTPASRVPRAPERSNRRDVASRTSWKGLPAGRAPITAGAPRKAARRARPRSGGAPPEPRSSRSDVPDATAKHAMIPRLLCLALTALFAACAGGPSSEPAAVAPAAAGTTSAGASSAGAGPAVAPTGADRTYQVYVGAESADLIHRVRLGPDGLTVEATTPVGEIPVETEGPHGLMVSGDGRHLYMTTAHGVPDGKLWKFDAGPDTLVAAPVLLGNFPATLDLTPDGLYAFVVNFNLHGEHVPSTVSVVYTPDMVEVDQIPTCTMPHGMRLSPDGIHAYSMCMMDDQLVEIDTRTFDVSRRFTV